MQIAFDLLNDGRGAFLCVKFGIGRFRFVSNVPTGEARSDVFFLCHSLVKETACEVLLHPIDILANFI